MSEKAGPEAEHSNPWGYCLACGRFVPLAKMLGRWVVGHHGRERQGEFRRVWKRCPGSFEVPPAVEPPPKKRSDAK